MSLTLVDSGGIEAKTCYGWPLDFSGTNQQMFSIGRREVPMGSAVEAIEIVLADPTFGDGVAVSGLKRWMAELTPVERADGRKWLRPSEGASFPNLERDMPEPSLEFLGYPLGRRDFMHLVHYAMTNTRLQMPGREGEDPRLGLINNLKAEVREGS